MPLPYLCNVNLRDARIKGRFSDLDEGNKKDEWKWYAFKFSSRIVVWFNNVLYYR